MANAEFRDGDGATKYLSFPTGDGSAGAPFVGYGGSILVQLQAIAAALGGTLTVDQATVVATLAALLSELQDKADVDQTQPVSLAVLPDTAGGTLAAILAALASVAVTGPLTDTQLRATAVPVSASGLPLPSGAATAANQAALIGYVDGIEAALAGGLSVTGPLTNSELRASAVPVSVSAALPAGTNNIGDVDIASIAAGDNNIGNVDLASAIPAGENLIGLVGASDIIVTVTPTLDTSAYTSGDLLFDSTEIANAVRANGGCAILQSITIVDKDDQRAGLTLLFADAATDFGTPNSAPDPDDGETATVLGHVAIVAGDYVDLGGASVACVRGLGLLLKAGAATTSLYVAAMTGGTPTHTASGLALKLGFLRS